MRKLRTVRLPSESPSDAFLLPRASPIPQAPAFHPTATIDKAREAHVMRYHEWNKAKYILKRKRNLWQHSFYALEDAEKNAYAAEAELDGVDDMLVAANQSVERLLEARLKKLQEEVVDGDEVAWLTRQIERGRREVVMMKYNLRLAKRELKKALRNYKRVAVRTGTRGKALVKADNITRSAFETAMAAAYEHHGLREEFGPYVFSPSLTAPILYYATGPVAVTISDL